MQIPYLSRHCRVITFDGRGNGQSDRPTQGYDEKEFAADALAVMDATKTDRAVLVSLSLGAQRAMLAADAAERVESAVFICPRSPSVKRSKTGRCTPGTRNWTPTRAEWLQQALLAQGLSGVPRVVLRPDVHRTALDQADRGLRRLGLETTPETLVAVEAGEDLDHEAALELCRRLQCRVLVIQGSRDAITGKGFGIGLADATGGELVMLEGSGHGPHVRDPVKVNLLLRDFIVPPARRAWVRGVRGASVRCMSRRRWARPCAARRRHRR